MHEQPPRRKPAVDASERWRLARCLLAESVPARWPALAGLVALALTAAMAEGSALLLLVAVVPLLQPDAGALPGWLPIAPTLPTVVAAYLGVAAAAAAAVYARALALSRLRSDTITRLRHEVVAAVLAAEWSWLRDRRGAELTRVATNDTAQVATGVTFVVSSASAAVRVPIMLSVAAGVSPGLTAIALVVAAACVALMTRLERRAGASDSRAGEAWRRLHGRVADVMAGRRVVKAGSLEEATLNDLESESRKWQAMSRAREDARARRRLLYQIALATAVAAGLLMAVEALGVGPAPALIAILALARAGQTGLTLSANWQMIELSLEPYAEIRRTLAAARSHREADAAGAVASPSRAIVLDGVSVSHGSEDRPALCDISVRIPIRALTAVSGPSGSGKSTLVDLVIGLTAPESGRMLLDDRSLDPAGRRAWRRQVGYLPQQPFLFDDTIRANLSAARPGVGEAEMRQALADADALDLLDMLPHGLDTEVGEHGGRLSGGERQRVALACALIRRPALLVLDEPTSGLDPASEERVVRGLARQAAERTVIVVTHRPEVATRCTFRIELAGGRIASAGPS